MATLCRVKCLARAPVLTDLSFSSFLLFPASPDQHTCFEVHPPRLGALAVLPISGTTHNPPFFSFVSSISTLQHHTGERFPLLSTLVWPPVLPLRPLHRFQFSSPLSAALFAHLPFTHAGASLPLFYVTASHRLAMLSAARIVKQALSSIELSSRPGLHAHYSPHATTLFTARASGWVWNQRQDER